MDSSSYTSEQIADKLKVAIDYTDIALILRGKSDSNEKEGRLSEPLFLYASPSYVTSASLSVKCSESISYYITIGVKSNHKSIVSSSFSFNFNNDKESFLLIVDSEPYRSSDNCFIKTKRFILTEDQVDLLLDDSAKVIIEGTKSVCININKGFFSVLKCAVLGSKSSEEDIKRFLQSFGEDGKRILSDSISSFKDYLLTKSDASNNYVKEYIKDVEEIDLSDNTEKAYETFKRIREDYQNHVDRYDIRKKREEVQEEENRIKEEEKKREEEKRNKELLILENKKKREEEILLEQERQQRKTRIMVYLSITYIVGILCATLFLFATKHEFWACVVFDAGLFIYGGILENQIIGNDIGEKIMIGTLAVAIFQVTLFFIGGGKL